MKNNFFLIFYIIVSTIIFSKTSFCESFNLFGNNIEILNKGSEIKVTNGEAFSKDQNLEIKSDKFIYKKKLDLLQSIGNGKAIFNSKKIIMEYGEAIFDKKNLLIKVFDDVKIQKKNGNFIIESDEVYFDQKTNIINSDKVTKFYYEKNKYYVDNFIYDIDNDLLKVSNLIGKDEETNSLKTSLAFINTKSGKIFGKDIKLELNNSLEPSKQSFRLSGNSIIIQDKKSEINKGVFTSCKKTEKCTPWQLEAKKIIHDNEKKEITYQDAVLKAYNIPIAYFPKFFHPDPSVKRKSGFLAPTLQDSKNSGSYIQIPYFFAMADNKDFTFSPRLYSEKKLLLQTEYRQKNKNSDQIVDFSLFAKKGSDKSKKHFFYELINKPKFENFEFSELKFKTQLVSDDVYLRTNKLKSELINNNNFLENSFNLDLYSNDLSINVNTTVYENLSKSNNDRYEYIFPKISIIKSFDNIFNFKGNFDFDSQFQARHFDTNSFEKINTNNLIYSSNNSFNSYGFLNNHKILIRNTNSENKNTSYKNKKNLFISSLYQFNTSLPLIKEDDDYQNILQPQFSFRAAPKHTRDEKNLTRKVNLTNLYALDRVTDSSYLEGGLSAIYGFSYNRFKKKENRKTLNINIANNLRLEKNDDLVNTNQLGEKTSNIFGEITFNPYEELSLRYETSIKNNLKDLSNENLVAQLNVNNLVTKFDYLNENNSKEKNSYLSNETHFHFNDFNSLVFSTRKNKSKDLTEYYKFMYQYKNDCLAASIEYDKDFYNDRELKPEENIYFKLSLIPFTNINTPNIK